MPTTRFDYKSAKLNIRVEKNKSIIIIGNAP